MAGFNLTAEINLRGPSNLKKVVGDIKRQLSGIQTNVDLKISDKAARNLDSITSSVNALNTALSKAQISANSLTSVLSSIGGVSGNTSNQLNNVSKSVTQVATSTASATKTIAQASSEMAEFGKQSALAVRRFAAFSVATGAIYGLGRAFASAYSEFIQFDKELVRLKQTVGSFGQDIDSISSEISRLSTTFGVSSSDLLKVSVTLAQAGLSARETKNALEALAKTSLSPSFEDITQTTEGAIAALRQFGLSTKDLEASLGSINAVAAAFAVESSDIISAIQRTGGVFANASKGISEGKNALNEFIAVFTSVRQTTRESAETIATGLRTIFTRIQRGSTIEALREYGVELTDLKGKFVGPYEAVRRLSEGLSQLDPRDIRFSKIVEELGGFRQIGKVIPLIQQFSVAQQALGVAQQGQTSLTTNAIQAQQALAVQFAKTREEFLAFVRALGQSDTFQNIISYGLSFTRVLIQIASAFKPLMPYLATLGALKGGAALTEYVGGFIGGLKKTNTTKTTASQQDLLGSLFGNVKEKSSADSSTTDRLESLIGKNNTALSNVNNALITLNRTLSSKTGGTPASGPSLGFASGGVVPGSGNRDTVPAMLTPGEFVIRKKAVETLGAGNLHRINKYASGGKVKDLIATKPDLTRYYDTENDKDTYSQINIDRPKEQISFRQSREKYRERAEKIWQQASSIFAQSKDLQEANTYIRRKTRIDPGSYDSKELDPANTSPQRFNRIQGALAEQTVRGQTRGLNKLPNSAGVDFSYADSNGTKFIEVKNRLEKTDDSDLISKALLGYAYINGVSPEFFKNNKLDEISGLNIELRSTNPLDIQSKNFGGIIQKFMDGGQAKLINLGTLSYSEDDVIKALREAENNPNLSPQEAINLFQSRDENGDFLYAYGGKKFRSLPKWFGIYKPAFTNLEQSIGQAQLAKQYRIQRAMERQGRSMSEYEGMTADQKSIYRQRRGFNNGGIIQKFMAGGAVGSVGGIESSLLSRFDVEKLEPTNSSDVEELIALIELMGGNEKTRNLANIQSINIGGRQIRSGDILSANKLRASKNAAYIPYARDIINAAIEKYNSNLESQAGFQQAMLSANQFQMATLLPFDVNKTIQAMIGGKATSIIAKGIPSENIDIIQELQSKLSSATSEAAEKIQMRKIFGSTPLVFDFDETLIENMSNLMEFPNGGVNTELFNDLPRVEKALESIKLTRLGEVLKAKLDNQEISPNDLRIVSARPQSNAPYMAKALARLGLNIPESRITGTTGAENKIHNVSEFETLIDDRLATVQQFQKAGKKAIGYAPIVSDFEGVKAVFAGQAAMEGAAAEKILANLGAPLRADAEPGRPIDYPQGLGLSAQYWGLDPNIPTEVKRELNSSAITRTKAEILRFYNKNAEGYKIGGEVEQSESDLNKDFYKSMPKFAKGGTAQDTVPALLTPGEFVINKKAAQRIGYGKLHQLNKADKLQGFNKGGFVGFAAGGKAAPGDYAAEVDNFIAQLVKLTQSIEAITYKTERASGKSVIEAKKQADIMAQLGVIDAGRATVYLNPESAQAIGDAVGKVLESYTTKINPLVEGGSRKTGYSITAETSGFAKFIEETTPKQNTAEKWKLLAAAAGESLDIFSDRVKRFTVDLAVSYKNVISKTQTRAKAAVALASNQPANEGNRIVAVELLRGLLQNYKPSETDKSKFTPEAVERTLNNAAKLMEQGLSFDQVKKSSDLLQIAFDDIIENSEALAVALSQTEKRFGQLTEKQIASETLMRGIESGRWQGTLSKIESMQASSEANPFWEKIAGNKFPGFDALNAKAPETAEFLSKVTEKLGGFIGVLGGGIAILGNSLPNIYEGLDKLAGSSLKNSEIAKGLGKALNQAGNDAIGMAKYAQQAELGAKGTGIAAGIGLTLGGIKGFAEGFITQNLENSNERIADSQEKITNLLNQLSIPGLEPAAQEDIKANALKEIQVLSNEIGTVLENTESYWSTSIYNLADSALAAAQTFLTIASTLALIKIGSGLTRSSGGYVGYYNNGNLVKNNSIFQPKGTDTVPAMLTPGEFVVNAQATKQNRGLLENINSGKYMARGGIVYAARGGMFGDWTSIQSDIEAGRNKSGYSKTFSDFYNPWDEDFYRESAKAEDAIYKWTGRISALVAIIASATAAVISFGPAVAGFFTSSLPALVGTTFTKITGFLGLSKATALTTTAAGVPVAAPQTAATAIGGGMFGGGIGGIGKAIFTIATLGTVLHSLYTWLSSSSQNKRQQQGLLLQGQIIDRLIEYAKTVEVKNISVGDLKGIMLGAKGLTGEARSRYFADFSPVTEAAQRAKLQYSGFNINQNQTIESFVASLDSANQEQARLILDSVKLEQIRASIVADETKKASLAGKSEEEAAARIKTVLAPLEDVKTFSEAQKQSFNNPVIRELLQRGQNLQAPISERIIAEETFGSMATKINAQVDMVVIALKGFEQGINRVSDSMNNLIGSLPTALGNRLGNDIPPVRLDRSDLAVLKNLSASSNQQIAEAVAAGGAQMGMTPQATKYFTQQFQVQKVLETELPLILSRIVAETKAGGDPNAPTASERLQNELETAISRVVPDKNTAQIITSGIVAKLNADNRGGEKGYERFIQDQTLLGNVLKQSDSSIQAYIKSSENIKSVIESLTQISDNYASALTKVLELQSNYARISAESAVSLKRALGEEVSLLELNKSFEDEIKGMTQGSRGFGTTDPREIGRRLGDLEQERQSILNELEARAGSDIRTRVEQGMTRPEFLEPQFATLGKKLGIVTSESDRLQKALQTLASNSQNAANVLYKIQELRRIDQAKETNFMDFLKNINNPEYLLDLQQTARSLSAVMSGKGTRFDIPGAIKGLEMRVSQMSPEDAAKERQAFLDQILKIEPALAQLFGPGGAFEGAFKIKNPQIQALQKQYDDLVARQLSAVAELQKRAIEGGNIILESMKDGSRIWYTAVVETAKFQNILRQQEIDRARAVELERQRQKERNDLGLPQVGAPQALSSGGKVIYAAGGDYVNFQPKGTDTVPAMLTPGEFVVNKKATQQNLPLLKAINSGSKGYSKGGIAYFQDGGSVPGQNRYYPPMDSEEFKTAMGPLFGLGPQRNDKGQILYFNGLPIKNRTLSDELAVFARGLNLPHITKSGSEYKFFDKAAHHITESEYKILSANDRAFLIDTGDLKDLRKRLGIKEETDVSRETAFLSGAGKSIAPGLAAGAAFAKTTAIFTPRIGAWSVVPGAIAGMIAGGATWMAQEASLDFMVPEANAYLKAAEKAHPVIAGFGGAAGGMGVGRMLYGPQAFQGVLGGRLYSGGVEVISNKGLSQLLGTEYTSGQLGADFMSGFAMPGGAPGSVFRGKINPEEALAVLRKVPIFITDESGMPLPMIQQPSNTQRLLGLPEWAGYDWSKHKILGPTWDGAYNPADKIIHIRQNSPDIMQDTKRHEWAHALVDDPTFMPDDPFLKNLRERKKLYRELGIPSYDSIVQTMLDEERFAFLTAKKNTKEWLFGLTNHFLGNALLDVPSSPYRSMGLPRLSRAIQLRNLEKRFAGYQLESETIRFLHSLKEVDLRSEAASRYFMSGNIEDMLDFGSTPQKYNKGGVVYANKGKLINFQPKGTDTVPAMLTPGEFVVNRKATQNNLPLLQNINNGYYNKGGRVKYLAKGGSSTNANMPINSGVSNISIDTSSLDKAFKAFADYVGSMKQSLDNFGQNIQGLQNLENGARSLSVGAASIRNASDNFSNNIRLFNSALASLERSINNIPNSISLQVTGSIPVNVNVQVNGGKDLDNSLQPFKDTIYSEITKAISDATQGNLNINLLTTKR